MKRLLTTALFVLFATACQPQDETISGYVPNDVFWVLKTMNDKPVSPFVTITFPTQGQVRGTGPCNSYSARQVSPLPWFQINGIAATRRMCRDIRIEQQYFKLLGEVTEAEALADTLLLKGRTGSLVFQQLEEPR